MTRSNRRRPSAAKRARKYAQPLQSPNPMARQSIGASTLCGPKRKFTYPSKSAAKRAAAAALQVFGHVNRPCRCNVCDLWHLTTTEPKGSK